MDFAEIKTKSVAELKEIIARERAVLSALRFKAHGRELKEVHKISAAKRTIARVMMVLAEKTKQK